MIFSIKNFLELSFYDKEKCSNYEWHDDKIKNYIKNFA